MCDNALLFSQVSLDDLKQISLGSVGKNAIQSGSPYDSHIFEPLKETLQEIYFYFDDKVKEVVAGLPQE